MRAYKGRRPVFIIWGFYRKHRVIGFPGRTKKIRHPRGEVIYHHGDAHYFFAFERFI